MKSRRVSPTTESRVPAILDCNVWIQLLLGKNILLQQKIMIQQYPIIITSYGIVEILRVLKRFASQWNKNYINLEQKFWEICNLESIQKEFQAPISESLLKEVKRTPEYRLIADILNLEVKDVPYIVNTYQFKAILVTSDERSLISKRQDLYKRLGIIIKSLPEFLEISKEK